MVYDVRWTDAGGNYCTPSFPTLLGALLYRDTMLPVAARAAATIQPRERNRSVMEPWQGGKVEWQRETT